MIRTKVLALFFITLLAGILAWQVTVQAHPLVPLPPELSQSGVAEQTAELFALKVRNELQNECAGLAIFAGLAVAAGGYFFSRGKGKPARLGISLAGSLIGAGTGVLMAITCSFLRDVLPFQWTPSTKATAIWAVLFLELAIASGIVANIGLGFDRHSMGIWSGGVVGALLAAVAYPFLVSLLFRLENSDPALPLGTYSRVLLFCLPTFLIFAFMEQQYSKSIAKVDEVAGSGSVT